MKKFIHYLKTILSKKYKYKFSKEYRYKYSKSLHLSDIMSESSEKIISFMNGSLSWQDGQHDYFGNFKIGIGEVTSGYGDWGMGASHTSEPEITLLLDKDLNIIEFKLGGFHNSSKESQKRKREMDELFCNEYTKLVVEDEKLSRIIEEFILKYVNVDDHPSAYNISYEELKYPMWADAEGRHRRNLKEPCHNCPFLKSTKLKDVSKGLDVAHYDRYFNDERKSTPKSCHESIEFPDSKKYDNEICVGHLACMSREHAEIGNSGEMRLLVDMFKKAYKKKAYNFFIKDIKDIYQYNNFVQDDEIEKLRIERLLDEEKKRVEGIRTAEKERVAKIRAESDKRTSDIRNQVEGEMRDIRDVVEQEVKDIRTKVEKEVKDIRGGENE